MGDADPIARANDLLDAGDTEAADKLLQEVLADPGLPKGDYETVMLTYLEHQMYPQAKAVFDLYKSRKGKVLTADYSREEVEKEERQNTVGGSVSGSLKVFKRYPVFPRAGFPYLEEIRMDDEQITVKRGGKEFSCRWADVPAVTIRVEKHMYRSGEDIKICVLRFPNNMFKFKIGDEPAFKNSGVLVRELKKHLQGRMTTKRDRWGEVRGQSLYFVLALALLALIEGVKVLTVQTVLIFAAFFTALIIYRQLQK